MKISFNSNPSRQEWGQLLKETPDNNFSLSWLYGEVSREKYGQISMYPLRVIASVAGQPRLMVQARVREKRIAPGVSITHVLYGSFFGTGIGSLGQDGKTEILPQLMAHIRKTVSRRSHPLFYQTHTVILRNGDALSHLMKDMGASFEKMYTPILNLAQGKDAIWQNMKSLGRQSIRQGKQREVTVEEISNEEGIEIFYRMEKLYKDSRWFETEDSFRRHLKTLIDSGNIRLFLAKVNDNFTSAMALVTYEDKMAYAIGAMDRDFQWHRPSNVLQWEVIKWGIRNGYSEYDMMGIHISKDDPTYSIGKFKASFGPEIRHLSVFSLSNLKIFGFNNPFLLALAKLVRKQK